MIEWETYKAAQAERWLDSCRSAIHYERTLRDQARQQLEAAEGLRGMDYSRVQVTTSPSSDAIPNAVVRHSETAELIGSIADDVARRISEAHVALAHLPTVEARCLTLYYLDETKPTWERVAHLMNYSERQVYEVRARGLVLAYDHMPARERDPMPPAL